MNSKNTVASDADKIQLDYQGELSAIDMDKAMTLLGGKIALLNKMLVIFEDKYNSADFQLSELISNKNWKEAEQFTLSIKSIAAKIGGNRFADAFAGIETDLTAMKAVLAETKSCNGDLLIFRMEFKKLLSKIALHNRTDHR